MAECELQIYPEGILRQTAAPVTEFNDDLAAKVNAMIEIMYENNGIGLAGNQAGLLERIIVADLTEDKDDAKAYINLEIIEEGKDTEDGEEGCLSIPGVYEKVVRPTTVKIKYQDAAGDTHEEDCEGLFARCMQHELDHLNGVLFIDRVSPIRKIGMKKKLRAFE